MRSTWLSRRAISLHITVVIVVPTFLALGDWQLHRALSGNELSWAYTFEWPLFTGYAIYMWWKLVHDVAKPRTTTDHNAEERENDQQNTDATTTQQDAELAAYNAYLAQLHRESRK